MLIVAAGAGGFGYALFGRRPIPETATASAGPAVAAGGAQRRRVAAELERFRRTDDVALTAGTRIRAALLLALTVAGLAALIGAVLSIVVVGVVFLAT